MKIDPIECGGVDLWSYPPCYRIKNIMAEQSFKGKLSSWEKVKWIVNEAEGETSQAATILNLDDSA